MISFIIICAVIIAISCFFLFKYIENNKPLFIITAILIIGTGGGYQMIGSPNAINRTLSHASDSALETTAPQLSAEKINHAINALESQLKQTPNDIKKLKLLANSYSLNQRYADSASVWQKIATIDGSSTSTLRQINMMISTQKGVINQSAYNFIDKILETEPQNPEALWLAGLYAAQNKRNEQAKQYWTKLIQLVSSEKQQKLQTLINQLDSNENKTNLITKNTSASNNKVDAINESIRIKISIENELLNSLEGNENIFVFVKALTGPPAPLAVKRLNIVDLPIEISLSDADAMIPELSISKFEKIELNAKISRSGNVANKENDISSDSISIIKKDNNKIYSLNLKKEN